MVVSGPGTNGNIYSIARHWGKLQIQNLLFESGCGRFGASGTGAGAPKDWIRQSKTHALTNPENFKDAY